MKTLLCAAFFTIFSFSSAFEPTFPFCEDALAHEINLDLSGAGIIRLKQSFIVSDFIKCLNLGSNGLSTLEDGAFGGLQGLMALDLSSNSLNLHEFLQIPELTHLKTLVLDRAFRVHNEYDPYQYHQVYPTENIPSELPVVVRQLEKLSMSNYGTKKMQYWLDKFGTMTNLTHLRLIGNSLTDLENLPHRLLQGLTHFWLDHNEITNFWGLDLRRVRYLSMDENKIEKLCGIFCINFSMSLLSMEDLEYLSLVGNKISSVDASAFRKLANLSTLNLAENLIETIPRHTFDNATALENLRLDGNRFQHVPDLTGLINLSELWIDANLIESIDEKSFYNLPKLRVISLRNNRLNTIPTGTFGNLPALRYLDLSGNSLVQLPPNWMGLDGQLDFLNLGENQFTDILDMSLEKFANLTILKIGQNPIRTVTIGSLIHLPPNTTLDVDYDCKNTALPIRATPQPDTTIIDYDD